MNAIDGNTFLTHLSGGSLEGESCAAGRSDPTQFRRLWSLWEIMKQFSVAKLLLIGVQAGMSRAKIDLSEKFPAPASSDKIQDTDLYLGAYKIIEQDCLALDLVSSLATVRKILSVLRKPDPNRSQVAPLDWELQGRLVDEAQTRIFWALSIRESDLYENPRKGWEEIIERFPGSVIDIEEASRCFALSRYAAAVFHSVQVVEVGLIELGKLIGVTDPKSGWTATTNRLAGIIKKGHEARTPYEKEHFAFFEQVQGTIEGLKNAWRNKVSHAQGRLALLAADFAPDIAEEILFASRAFMRRLATESPPSADASAPPGA